MPAADKVWGEQCLKTQLGKPKPFNFCFLFLSLSESNFQAAGRNNLKIHLKFLQDLAFSFHISTSGVSQNSMSLQNRLRNLAAESFKTA